MSTKGPCCETRDHVYEEICALNECRLTAQDSSNRLEALEELEWRT